MPELFESQTCDVLATVQLPEQAGIEHTGEEDDHIRTVSATIDDSLIVRPDVELDPWALDVTPKPCEDTTQGNDSDGNNAEDSCDGEALVWRLDLLEPPRRFQIMTRPQTQWHLIAVISTRTSNSRWGSLTPNPISKIAKKWVVGVSCG